jgi:hypothetical protein
MASAALLCILTVGVAFAESNDLTAAEWLSAIDTAERVEHSYSVIAQTITTSSGSERTLRFQSWSGEQGDLGLMAYTEPARVRGDKILLRDGGDNIWYYMHRRDVTRHFAGHTRRQSAMGSDFSYEDLSTGDMTEDYTAALRGFETLDTTECVKLRCVPTESGPTYDSIVVWAAIRDSLSRKIEYYDDGSLLKTLHMSDFKVVDGRKMAMYWEMVNDREGSRTIMETTSITLKNESDPTFFTRRSLSRPVEE